MRMLRSGLAAEWAEYRAQRRHLAAVYQPLNAHAAGGMIDRLQLLLAYLDEDPEDPFTRFALAQEYLKRGDLSAAASYFERLVDEAPDYIGTYYHLGKLYERTQRKTDAIRTYEKGVEMARAHRDFHALSELQGALQEAKGIGWDDE